MENDLFPNYIYNAFIIPHRINFLNSLWDFVSEWDFELIITFRLVEFNPCYVSAAWILPIPHEHPVRPRRRIIFLVPSPLVAF